MSDQFVAEIRIFSFNFAPTGWALCDGQILPISQNTALFSLLGTTYGGNGQSTMDLSNLDNDDADACLQALKKVNLTNKAASLIIDKPAGAAGHTGGKVGDPQGFTDAIRAWIDNE